MNLYFIFVVVDPNIILMTDGNRARNYGHFFEAI